MREETLPQQVEQRVQPTRSSPQAGKNRHRVFLLLLLPSGLLILVLLMLLLIQTFSLVFSTHTPVPILNADRGTFPTLKLATGKVLIYAQAQGIELVPVDGGTPWMLETPGYLANLAVPPVLLPSGQLLYSGQGLWLIDPLSGHARQIAPLGIDRVVTSLVVSEDGAFLAWSSAPRSAQGMVEIYAGPVEQTVRVYQQQAGRCPCFRVFAWQKVPVSGSQGVLLLTNDRGDPGLARQGLWVLSLNNEGGAQPRRILPDGPPQGPLVFAHDLLVYTQALGYVAMAEDGSVPRDLATQSYANDLMLARLDPVTGQVQAPQTLVPGQTLREVEVKDQPIHYQSTPVNVDYHWLATPRFSSNASQLAYIQFTSQREFPFQRQCSLYLVQIQRHGETLSLTPARLQASVPNGYVELGGWLDDRTLTLVARDALYALDIQQGALAKIAPIEAYGKVVGAVVR